LGYSYHISLEDSTNSSEQLSVPASHRPDGSFIPFARTKQEREAAGDPRPSLEERYGSRDAYVAKVEAAAEALVAERLLLPADAAAYVKAAKVCDRL
jgi:Alpha/beta hydrolase domain